MGILSTVSVDIEQLVKIGYTDDEIAKAVGMDINIIKFVIDYIRKNLEKKPK